MKSVVMPPAQMLTSAELSGWAIDLLVHLHMGYDVRLLPFDGDERTGMATPDFMAWQYAVTGSRERN